MAPLVPFTRGYSRGDNGYSRGDNGHSRGVNGHSRGVNGHSRSNNGGAEATGPDLLRVGADGGEFPIKLGDEVYSIRGGNDKIRASR